MKNYFTRGEFAKLRNIDMNSIRYYEKLGILTPVYVDTETNYHYYSAEQLAELDAILLCINLGIPLKQLKNYIDESGTFHNRALVEEGKRLVEEKIQELNNGLKSIEHTLDYLENTEKFANYQGVYIRNFQRRNLITKEFKDSLTNVNQVEKAFASLHNYAREKKLHPVMPMGVLFQYIGGELHQYVCWELAETEVTDEHIIVLPEGDYQCVQTDWKIASDIRELVEDTFEIKDDSTIFVSNMAQSRFRFGNKVGELQMLQTT